MEKRTYDKNELPETSFIPFIANGIVQTEKDIPKSDLPEPLEIYYVIENNINFIRVCAHCLEKDTKIKEYLISIGLEPNVRESETQKIGHGICTCCFEEQMKLLDELTNCSEQTNSVLDSEK